MSELFHILDELKAGKPVTRAWIMLLNAYFRGGEPELAKWAADNRITYRLERDQVTFYPPPAAKNPTT